MCFQEICFHSLNYFSYFRPIPISTLQHVSIHSKCLLTVRPQETAKSSMYYVMQMMKGALPAVLIKVRVFWERYYEGILSSPFCISFTMTYLEFAEMFHFFSLTPLEILALLTIHPGYVHIFLLQLSIGILSSIMNALEQTRTKLYAWTQLPVTFSPSTCTRFSTKKHLII